MAKKIKNIQLISEPIHGIKTMDKREFLMQYVLNRAATLPISFNGEDATQSAIGAYNMIEKACEGK
jgi:hypothetical protein